MPRRSTKPEEAQPRNLLLDAIDAIQSQNQLDTEEKSDGIVDIVTFCNDPKYLNLPATNFYLRMSQKVMLKCFYMKTRGNEDLKLDQEEWQWLYDHRGSDVRDGVEYGRNIDNVIHKIEKLEGGGKDVPNFRELTLVLGRRGGKTILASIISAYEVYKLLVIGDGNPHKFYDLPDDDEIAVINVALSLKQAGRLFVQIQSRLRNSPFFENRIAKETTSEIRLYTDSDLEKKRKGSTLTVPGSILILCGHSNPDTLAGYSAILILFDELAFYDESGKVTGRYFYDRLKPSLAHFFNYGEGRLVEISSPNAMAGIFYEIFKNSNSGMKEYDHILSFQLPTWDANPTIPYDHPDLVTDRLRNIDRFSIEYGAQFAKSGVFGNYFEEGLIQRCIRLDIGPHERPEPGFNYYLHIDPGKSNPSRYSAVLIAKERYHNFAGKRRVRIRLANVWTFDPVPGIGLPLHQIDKQIIQICAKYHPMAVTYDQFSSDHSLQLLRSHGIHCRQLAYNRGFKERAYQNLKDLMLYEPIPELWIYDDPLIIMELKALKFKQLKRGISIIPDKDGDVTTDDLTDCLAGASMMATENIRMALPEPVVVQMGYR